MTNKDRLKEISELFKDRRAVGLYSEVRINVLDILFLIDRTRTLTKVCELGLRAMSARSSAEEEKVRPLFKSALLRAMKD